MATATAARERAAAAGDLDAIARLRGRRPAEETVPLATDDELLHAWQEVKKTTFAGRMSKVPAERAKADGELAGARADLEARGLVLWQLRNKGRRKYDEVLRACGPTDEQRAEAKAKGQVDPPWNNDTFPVGLIALCTVGELEGVTPEQITELMDGEGQLSEGEVAYLFNKALALYNGTRIPDLGK